MSPGIVLSRVWENPYLVVVAEQGALSRMPTSSSKPPCHLVMRMCVAPALASPGLCRPERWECVPEAVKAMPSVFGNLLTFITGAHACIGYRFSLIECVSLCR
jgi:hypothetical protein